MDSIMTYRQTDRHTDRHTQIRTDRHRDLRCPVDSILDAVLTVSPNRQ